MEISEERTVFISKAFLGLSDHEDEGCTLLRNFGYNLPAWTA